VSIFGRGAKELGRCPSRDDVLFVCRFAPNSKFLHDVDLPEEIECRRLMVLCNMSF
jgi:hypothetical protein